MRSIILAFAMFSRIPMPRVEWREDAMRHVMAAFPLVGAAVGAAIFGWGRLTEALAFGPFLRGAGFVAVSAALTGCIHLDGFCDTTDALASQGDVAKRQRILKDPHLGAFAAIVVALYLLVFAGLASELSGAGCAVFAGLFVLSRAWTGLAILRLPAAAHSSLGAIFNKAASGRSSSVILVLWLVASTLYLIFHGGAGGAAAAVVSLALFLCFVRMARKKLEGMSGDLAGWFVQVCELATLAALVVGEKI